MKRTKTASERRYLAAVAALPCIVCMECLGQLNHEVQVHHVKTRHGWGRSSHFDTLPLCWVHHQDQKYGVHGMGKEQFTAMYGKSEIELLQIVKEKLHVE